MRAGNRARPKVQRLGRCPVGVRRFKSGPAHCCLLVVLALSNDPTTIQMSLEKPRTLERCPGFDTDMLEPNRNINIVQKRQEAFLSDKQLVDLTFYTQLIQSADFCQR
jgi:hypothetical protein